LKTPFLVVALLAFGVVGVERQAIALAAIHGYQRAVSPAAARTVRRIPSAEASSQSCRIV
jgi:hypothetical protein